MKQGIPASVLVQRLAFVLSKAEVSARAGEPTKELIKEAQSVLDQLREAI